MINNEFYKHLDEKWYTAKGEAVALLRLENLTKVPWVIAKVHQFHSPGARVLDVGCGSGALVLQLAEQGFACTGIDVSEGVLAAGRRRDEAGRVQWATGQAERLPFADTSFDVVCLLDVLEHIFEPRLAVQEAVRVLRPGGTLLLHTFNRTWRSWLLAAKGLDWFIKDSQSHIHDWRLFIPPGELQAWLRELGWDVIEFQGLGPRILSRGFLKLVLTRRVPEDFSFQLTRNLKIGYLGCARLLD
ncbi:MAG: bifunctional 2-polyprenyl-6-hydroxyphenol methylase/3-demethylubiquinol 3-O-methyltransferase UbiG [Bdellovibrionales bacterium]